MTEQILVFKNNLPNLTVLKLFSQDFSQVKSKLQQKFKQAPMMFIGMQVIVDLSAFDKEVELVLDTNALLTFLAGEGLSPVAVMSDRQTVRETLVKFGVGAIPVLQAKADRPEKIDEQPAKTEQLFEKNEVTAPEKPIHEEPRKTFDEVSVTTNISPINHIIRHPIRSGQRIYVHGDLTIVGSVSNGAEIIADGSIHVYGKLHGRAIAGAKGDEGASIFCKSLDAELVSIAGNYKQLEDIEAEYRDKPIQILLQNEKIVFSSL